MIESAARINKLDGVRAASIILVLITHLFPVKIGGSSYNELTGMLGMALFFGLSGYLISVQACKITSAKQFLMRRLLRVVPSAWLCIAIVACFVPISWGNAIRYGLFIANIPQQTLASPLDHLWSLCVEVQFYVAVAGLMVFGMTYVRNYVAVFLVFVTILRITMGVNGTSITWYRIDDILAGATMGFLLQSQWRNKLRHWLGDIRLLFLVCPLLLLSAHIPHDGSINIISYFRPYLCASFLAIIICTENMKLDRILGGKTARYIATISYALYIWHIPLAATWLGSGDLLEKYAKRPLLLAVLMLVAHFSTFYYERFFNGIKKINTAVIPV